ncbi:hypothetical protein CF344_17775 [Pseudomonas aeruginosa]|uniref:DUF262 domain-containing protein n=1 Tax=Pseudomonas tohonis TaxID=2725477 RepID=A0ABQ4W6F4_9PSED|nr:MULTISPECIES: DUF262 domain-containing protein [Pseudomonas]OXT66073.1 hypothetical protein CF344_17775 [Pseudomonas aeruginosa]GJN55057.1 hypothetical protein TUM20286_48090 [Pseudomonas tohonis]
MNEWLKDEYKPAASSPSSPDIVVASTSLAALLGGEPILGSNDQLISGRLNIPEYQRPYRWQTKHLKRLLDDLTEFFSPAANVALPQHDFYLGSIIVHQTREQGRRKEVLNIIDGQQRLISMALLAYLLDERALANSVSLVAPETQKRAHLNLKWLEQQQLPEVDFTRVNVTLVVTRLEDDAYRFFETQNTGGVRLGGADIIKAHHLRAVPQEDQDDHARRWEAWGDLSDLIDAVMKARHWQTLNWRGLSGQDQPVQAREEVVTELAERTGRGIDLAYRTVIISPTRSGQTLHMASCGYTMRQPLNAGVNAIHYLEYFQNLRERLLVTRREKGLAPFYDFYDDLVVKANGSKFLRKLFDCAVLLYASKFGYRQLPEAGPWLFQVVFAPRVINEKAVREDTAQSFVRTTPLLDWIAGSFTHDQLIETLKGFSYRVSNRVDNNSVKYRFVRAVQTYFSIPSIQPGEQLSDDYDTQLKQAITLKLETLRLNQGDAQ